MRKYQALYERYRGLISSGTYAPGDRLPSLRRVAAEEGLGLNTARSAFDLLEREGLARPRERGGYYVRGGKGLVEYQPPPACHLAQGLSSAEKMEYLLGTKGSEASVLALAAPGPDLLPLAQLERRLPSLKTSWTGYGEVRGDEELRRRMAAFYHPCHGELSPEDIIVTAGATEALGIVFRALLSPGDTVIVESPTYFDYFRQLAAVKARVVEVPLAPGLGIDLDLLARELGKRRVRMILVQPNVQNPAGSLMPDAEKARLVELAARHGAILVQDDVYGDLAFSGARPANLSAFGDYPGIVYLSSFSKSLAPGLRLGWLHSRGFRRELATMKGLSSLSASRLSQAALASFLGGPAYRRHLETLRSELSSRFADYAELLASALPEGSSLLRPAGGCLLWLALPEGYDASAVFERAAAEDILAAPGELFSANPFFRRHFRLNFGYRLTEARRAALSRLCAIAREEGGAPGRRRARAGAR